MDFFTQTDAAIAFNVSPATITNWVKTGKLKRLPAEVAGRNKFLEKASVDALLNDTGFMALLRQAQKGKKQNKPENSEITIFKSEIEELKARVKALEEFLWTKKKQG